MFQIFQNVTLGRASATHNRRASSIVPWVSCAKWRLTVLAIRLVVERPELVGGALHIALAEDFVDGLGTVSCKRRGPNILVVVVAVRNRLLEDGRIRGHPSQSILLDHTAQPCG